jgi:hypothetical protein
LLSTSLFEIDCFVPEVDLIPSELQDFAHARAGDRQDNAAPIFPTVFGWFNLNSDGWKTGFRLAKTAISQLQKLKKINRLAGAARVDIAGVASSILATPTIFPVIAVIWLRRSRPQG